jgi:alpha-galactosidase
MRLQPLALSALTSTRDATAPGDAFETPFENQGHLTVGPLEVAVHLGDGADGWAHRLVWSVTNRSDQPQAVRSVAMRCSLDGAGLRPRMFRQGYQSWSPTGMATFGVDVDPSTVADLEFLQAVHHADQRTAMAGELRAEGVTALVADPADGIDAGPLVVGFIGGTDHDGTLRLKPTGTGGSAELWIEAFFGDAVFAPGESRPMHPVVIGDDHAEPFSRLEAWADAVGAAANARTAAPYQVGWCSWYHYFYAITADALADNLARSAQWPFDVFQLDDGYQSAIGDWLTTNDTFPDGLAAVADAIAASGRQPGLWLAPFLAAPGSRIATEHPDWLTGHESGKPLLAWWNPDWGDSPDGFMYGLDTTNPEVLEHLRSLAAELVGLGFTYLKLDFTFSPSHDGIYHDPTRTPAQRVRAGYQAFRDGAGDDAFILACGAPLFPIVGLVDANRIGQDVAPLWELTGPAVVAGYRDIEPSTQNAYGNTVARSFLHRRLWLNDPDCLMLRQKDTELAPEAMRTWAHTVAVSGGMALVSDDLALLDDEARALLDDVIAIGRASDAEAVAGRTPRPADFFDATPPTRFAAAGFDLRTDPTNGSSTLTRP